MEQVTSKFASCYDSLTQKQLETLEVVAEGRTHKELAATFGISVSAATQRIEGLRAKFGGVTKAELARIHRQHVENKDCKTFTGKISQLPKGSPPTSNDGWNYVETDLSLADESPVFTADAPWQSYEPHVVPEVLDGDRSTSTRLVAAFGIAIGILVFGIVLLAIANMIGEMF